MLSTELNALRSRFKRRGLRLMKSKARDPERLDYGSFLIADARTNFVIAGGQPWTYSLSLEDVRAWDVELRGRQK